MEFKQYEKNFGWVQEQAVEILFKTHLSLIKLIKLNISLGWLKLNISLKLHKSIIILFKILEENKSKLKSPKNKVCSK